MNAKDSDSRNELTTQAADYVASSVKVALGAVPFAGSLLAEIAGTIIPNQRIDRITDFAKKLDVRIHALEEKTIRPLLKFEWVVQ